jgi:glycolate oxidase FAD binding subunit
VARHEREARTWAAQAGCAAEALTGDAEASVWRTVRDFGWAGTDVAVRISVPAGQVLDLLHRLGGVLPSTAGVVAHLPSGTLWLSLDALAAPALLPRLRDLAVSHSGHWLLARAPQAVKAGADVWAPLPEPRVLALLRGLKQAFDPHDILNPGRFVARL